MKGKLYLLPAFLAPDSPSAWVTEDMKQIVQQHDVYFVENPKAARKVIKEILPEKKQSELRIFQVDKDSRREDVPEFMQLLSEGTSVCYLSDAGLPCIADPGNILVAWCHEEDIEVVPLSGPSSIILALISSGFNGQEFSFHGYLPIDKQERKNRLLKMEQDMKSSGYSQIFMETPYRNMSLFEDMLKYLQGITKVSIAAGILDKNHMKIKSMMVKDWKKYPLEIHKIPAIFIIGK